MLGVGTQNTEQRWAGLGGSGRQEADVLDISSLGAPLLLIWEVSFVVNLGPTMVCSLAVPQGGGSSPGGMSTPRASGKAAGRTSWRLSSYCSYFLL